MINKDLAATTLEQNINDVAKLALLNEKKHPSYS